MTRTTIFSALAAAVTLTAASPLAVAGSPGEFRFDAVTVDLGTVPVAAAQTATFAFTNSGDEPLLLSNVQATSGAATFSKAPVKRGDKGSFTYRVTPTAPGPFTRALTVTSNAKTPTTYVYVKGIAK